MLSGDEASEDEDVKAPAEQSQTGSSAVPPVQSRSFSKAHQVPITSDEALLIAYRGLQVGSASAKLMAGVDNKRAREEMSNEVEAALRRASRARREEEKEKEAQGGGATEDRLDDEEVGISGISDKLDVTEDSEEEHGDQVPDSCQAPLERPTSPTSDEEPIIESESEVLASFLRLNRFFRNSPAEDVEWLAARLQPEKVGVGPIVVASAVGDADPSAASKAASQESNAAAGGAGPPPEGLKLSIWKKLQKGIVSQPVESPSSTGENSAKKLGRGLTFVKAIQMAQRAAEPPVDGDKPQLANRSAFEHRMITSIASQEIEEGPVVPQLPDGKVPALRFLVAGHAEWRGARGGEVALGDALVDLTLLIPGFTASPSFMDAHAVSPVLFASVPIDVFMTRFGEGLRQRADLAGALVVASTKEPARRKASEIATLSRYLRKHPSFSKLPLEALQSVARAIRVRNLERCEVLALEGSKLDEMFIPVTGAITAWRNMKLRALRRGASLPAESCLSEAQASQAQGVVKEALAEEERQKAVDGQKSEPESPSESGSPRLFSGQEQGGMSEEKGFISQSSHQRGSVQGARGRQTSPQSPQSAPQSPEQLGLKWPSRNTRRNEKALVCVDITEPDNVVRAGEWSLISGRVCSATLFVQIKGKAFFLPRTEYVRHVTSHRVDDAPLEATLFLASMLPVPYRLFRDEWWLQETALARSYTLRLLPPALRGSALMQGRLKTLEPKEWLCQEADGLQSCFLLLKGSLELELPRHSAEGSGARMTAPTGDDSLAGRVLKPGAVLGEWVAAQGLPPDERWGLSALALEPCQLFEIRQSSFKAAFRSELALMTANPPTVPVLQIEEALWSPPGQRSLQQLRLLASVLERNDGFARLDSYVRLDLCQWLSHREMQVGEAVGVLAFTSCAILSGEIGIYGLRSSAEVLVLRLPAWTFIGDEANIHGDGILRATAVTSLLCLDRGRLPQAKTGPGADKASHAANERSRAVQALRLKAPESRTAEEVALLSKLVRGNPFYAQLEDSVREGVCRSMTYMEFQPKSNIIRQGDVADVCYILLKGVAGIWVEPKSAEDGDGTEAKGKGTKPTLKQAVTMTKKTLKMGVMKTIGLRHKLLENGQNPNSYDEIMLQAQQESAERPEDERPQLEIDQETGGPVGATFIKVLAEGACFGEAGLLHGARRNACIMARDHCMLGAISKAVFEQILRAAFLAQEQQRIDFIRRHLPKTQNGTDHAQALGGFFSPTEGCRGSVLCTTGKACDRLIMVREGSCKVYWKRDGHPQEVGEVVVGQLIGLASLVLGLEVEPYTVVCATPQVKILKMEAADARNRISGELKEALVNFERLRLERLDSRVKFLTSAYSTKAQKVRRSSDFDPAKGLWEDLPEASEAPQWLESSFLVHKRDALLNNKGGKMALLNRFFEDKQNTYHVRRSAQAAFEDEHGALSGDAVEGSAPRSLSPPRARSLSPGKTGQEQSVAVSHVTSPRRHKLQKLMDLQLQDYLDMSASATKTSSSRLTLQTPREREVQQEKLREQKHRRQIANKQTELQKEVGLEHMLTQVGAGKQRDAETHGGFYIPGTAGPSQHTPQVLPPVWLPSDPPQAVMRCGRPPITPRPPSGRPRSRERPRTPRNRPPTPTTAPQRILATPKTPPARKIATGTLPSKPGDDEEDSYELLLCRPLTPSSPLLRKPNSASTPGRTRPRAPCSPAANQGVAEEPAAVPEQRTISRRKSLDVSMEEMVEDPPDHDEINAHMQVYFRGRGEDSEDFTSFMRSDRPITMNPQLLLQAELERCLDVAPTNWVRRVTAADGDAPVTSISLSPAHFVLQASTSNKQSAASRTPRRDMDKEIPRISDAARVAVLDSLKDRPRTAPEIIQVISLVPVHQAGAGDSLETTLRPGAVWPNPAATLRSAVPEQRRSRRILPGAIGMGRPKKGFTSRSGAALTAGALPSRGSDVDTTQRIASDRVAAPVAVKLSSRTQNRSFGLVGTYAQPVAARAIQHDGSAWQARKASEDRWQRQQQLLQESEIIAARRLAGRG
ncbi:unnamed protein product [Polarella glacialis]|uniref:Cyclic nucleotide-binding domain-containing protein n=1 Tax=Polarella glacialis TaxID=89957 RepID=A0A813JNW1_POLGL|nr:unnamed protein product [Polarella glacialis]